jgi:hypothetical protein
MDTPGGLEQMVNASRHISIKTRVQVAHDKGLNGKVIFALLAVLGIGSEFLVLSFVLIPKFITVDILTVVRGPLTTESLTHLFVR